MSAQSITLSSKQGMTLIIVIILITDLAVVLNIPVLRAVFGVITFCFLLGLLLLFSLKLDKIDLTDKTVLSVGLSVALLMALGGVIDNLLFGFGYETPLSTTPLVLSFSIIIFGLSLLAYKINRNAFSLTISSLNLDPLYKKLFIIPVIFPVMGILSVLIMDLTGNNFFILTLLVLIPTYISLILISSKACRIPGDVYSVAIYMIGISLLFMYFFRLSHFMGQDIHLEYRTFQQVSANLHYAIDKHSLINSCLSISLLPTVYQSLLGMKSIYIFKVIYPMILAITPICIFIISKKYVRDSLAFLAAFFFIAQTKFFTITDLRSPMATFFIALSIMILFHDKIKLTAKRGLFLFMIFGIIVTHYSASIVFTFLLITCWVICQILPKNYIANSDTVTAGECILCSVFIFFWHSQLCVQPFSSIVGYVQTTGVYLKDLFVLESRSGIAQDFLSASIPTIPARIHLYLLYITIALIALGIFTVIMKYKGCVRGICPDFSCSDFLKTKIEVAYLIFAGASFLIISIYVVLPFVSTSYDLARLYVITLVFLSVFFVIGGVIFSRFLKISPYIGLMVILIVYFMFTTGVAYQAFGDPRSVILNSEGDVYNRFYFHNQEVYAVDWVAKQSKQNDKKVYSGWVGVEERLIEKLPLNKIRLLTPDSEVVDSYIYLRYYNVVSNKIYDYGYRPRDLKEYFNIFCRKSKIYNNGGSDVYK